MSKNDFLTTIRNYGSISVERNCVSQRKKTRGFPTSTYSTDDFVGKITSIFMPYIPQNLPENKFITIQDELKKIVVEIKRN